MEPVTTTIVAALVAGATAVASKVADEAIKDAYKWLKSLITKNYGSAAAILEEFEKEPDSEVEQAVIAKRLDKAGASSDAELQNAAQALFEKMEELRGVPAAAPLFDFERLRTHKANLTRIRTAGTVLKARDAEIGELNASDIEQTSGANPRKN
jgi:hypothetical protein